MPKTTAFSSPTDSTNPTRPTPEDKTGVVVQDETRSETPYIVCETNSDGHVVATVGSYEDPQEAVDAANEYAKAQDPVLDVSVEVDVPETPVQPLPPEPTPAEPTTSTGE
jgi:hypothetical protein